MNVIARLGQSPGFVTAMAHAWFAYAVIATCAHFGLTLWIAAPAAVMLAAAKEYGFDLKYETNPPQTVVESTQDFIEYLAGIVLAMLVIR
jgi:hypothetical protein